MQEDLFRGYVKKDSGVSYLCCALLQCFFFYYYSIMVVVFSLGYIVIMMMLHLRPRLKYAFAHFARRLQYAPPEPLHQAAS